MIAPMTKYSFILLSGMQDSLMDTLQETGLVDISRSSKPVDDHSRELVAEIELLDGLIKGLQKAEVPEGTEPEYIDGDIERLAGGMLMRYSDDAVEMEAIRKQIHQLKIWGNFNPDILKKLDQAGVPIHFHSLPTKQFMPNWADEYPLSVIDTDKTHTWFVVAGEDSLPGEIPLPTQNAAQLEKDLRDRENHYSHVLARIASAKARIPELEEKRARCYSELDKYLAGCTAVPAAEDTLLTYVEDNPPISFHNNWFVRQFETLTDMYGRPAYDGFDPTPFISIFFMLFFAFCMGDCGYGLVLLAAGLLLKKVDSFKDMAPLVVILGVATMVIGFLFHTFFSMDISQWQVFAPIKGIFLPAQIAGNDATMVLALVVGILHICLAMVVKTIHQTRTKGFFASLGTWGWTLLIVGGVTVAAFALAGVLDANLTKLIVIVLGVVSALGIFVFNDPKRNKFANIGMGLWDTYNMITGLMGDVLSYLRLYALGLAGSMLGMAFNDMGLMVLGNGSNAILWLPFILLVVIGHTLNIAMCALGAFVHPLRLNFLEFFKNSGYEASGRSYNPLKK